MTTISIMRYILTLTFIPFWILTICVINESNFFYRRKLRKIQPCSFLFLEQQKRNDCFNDEIFSGFKKGVLKISNDNSSFLFFLFHTKYCCHFFFLLFHFKTIRRVFCVKCTEKKKKKSWKDQKVKMLFKRKNDEFSRLLNFCAKVIKINEE